MARQSISRIFTLLAEQNPDRVVVRDDLTTVTALDLDRSSNRLARSYLSLGVTTDSLVTVALPNTVEMITVCVAIWKCGATPQPISTGLTTAERSAVEALVEPSLVIGYRPSSDTIPWLPAGWTPLPSVSDAGLPDRWAASWKAPTTSGSTGSPKVVKATAPALLDPEQPVSSFLPREQTQLVSGPLTHSATFTYAFRGLMTGHNLILLPRFDERRFLTAITEHHVSWALIVPTMMHRLLRLPETDRARADVSSIKTFLHMGAPCPPDLKRRFMDWVGAEHVTEVYAGSESNGIVTIQGDEWLAHPGSVGRPGNGTSVSIRSDDGHELSAGQTGRIWLRREGDPTYAYLGGNSARTTGGWDTLGDLGRLDQDGYLYVTDRADDVILRGGINIHPAEVEQALERHPDVRSAVAYGVPDIDLGQRIEAVIDIGTSNRTADDLKSWIRSHLDSSRRPSAVHVVTEPVRTDAGKTNRRAFATRFSTYSGR